MKKRLFALFAFLCLFSSAVCKAQDQVEIINEPPKLLDPSIAPKTIDLSTASAAALIERTLGAEYVTDTSYYTLIHILKWKSDQLVVEGQRWYVFNGGKWSPQQFEGTRIFGSSHIAVLYIHINARGVPVAKLTDAEKKLSERSALSSTNDRLLVRLDSEMLIESDYLKVTYRVEVTKKLPSPVQNLAALIGLAQGDTSKRAVEPVAYYGGRKMVINHVPSDVTVRASMTQGGAIGKDTELGKQTFDNEGRYFWDVSVGLPISKIKELSFNAQDGTVRPKEIDRQKLFAMFNIFFRPIDTKDLHSSRFPHFMAGVALSKKPLDRVFAGAGYGLNKVQVFAGVAFNRVAVPQTLSSGASASQSQLEADLRQKYSPKFVFGLNLPVRQVVDALKANK